MTFAHRATALVIAATFLACGGSSSGPPPAPTFTSQPQTQTVLLDGTATFTARAVGTGALTYQWYRDGTAIAGQTLTTYTTGAATFEDDDAAYTISVSDTYGHTTVSEVAYLRIEGFHDTGSMTAARQNAAAAQLDDGTVIVTGGQGAGATVLASCELFDPLTGLFTATDTMEGARQNHTASTLADGKVLVAGGQGGSGGGTPLATAEVYDPRTGLFGHTGNMAVARFLHTATVLANGKVLLTGGRAVRGQVTITSETAELFDPATGTFAATGSLAEARYSQTATLLSNGKVLVAGGYGATGHPLATAELYDPATGLFTSTGRMSQARFGHAAVAIAGGVLVAGGASPSVLATTEVYSESDGTFLQAGSLAGPRAWASATALENGEVIVAGGTNGTAPLATAQIYDPVSATFDEAEEMYAPRYLHVAVPLADGGVLFAGGWSMGDQGLPSAEIFYGAD